MALNTRNDEPGECPAILSISRLPGVISLKTAMMAAPHMAPPQAVPFAVNDTECIWLMQPAIS